MYLRRDFRYLLIILIVPFIPYTTSHSCKQEESFWQGLPGRVWGGSSPWSRNDPSRICQAFTYLEGHYETLCPGHHGNTGLEYWLGAFGASSAPEGITIHNGLCQISGQMLSFSAKIADTLLYFCTSIQDMGFQYMPSFDDDDVGSVGCKGDSEYAHMQDVIDLVKQIYDVFWKIVTTIRPKKVSMPTYADNADIIAVEAGSRKSTWYTLYIVGICTVFAIGITCLTAAYFSRYRSGKPQKAITLMRFTTSFVTYSVVNDPKIADVYIECLRSHATPSARSLFLKKMKMMRTLKALGASNQPSLMYLKEWFADGNKLHLVMPNMRYGKLLGLMKCCPDRLDFNSRISVFKQIFPAVKWLHQVGWAHLNIHPGAIFVGDTNCQVKLGKFTHAVETKEAASKYNLHPNCCAPEVFRQKPYDAKKADLWALGALLFSLFSDVVLPFRGFKPSPSLLNPRLVGFNSHAHSDELIMVLFNLLCGKTKHRDTLMEILNAAVNDY